MEEDMNNNVLLYCKPLSFRRRSLSWEWGQFQRLFIPYSWIFCQSESFPLADATFVKRPLPDNVMKMRGPA